MVGDNLVLVDGEPKTLHNPVELYQGAVVVSYKFKQDIIDVLFKASAPSPEARLPLRSIRKIVIDAGHGGSDPGAIGKLGLREKDVTLDIAKRLNSLFKAEGIQVVMTRSTDKFVPLSTRVDIANNSGADLFISVHANANRVSGLNGFEVYYVSTKANDSQRAELAAKEARLNLDDSYFASNSTTLKAILWDMLYTYDRAESIDLARYICRDIDQDVNCRILGIKEANFYVLKGVRVPAVLLEVGFVSNYKEERMLKNDYYRQQIAQAIAQGIENYIRGDVLMEAYSR
jgi:N-acetylmuramoyl-L-alanine amidase